LCWAIIVAWASFFSLGVFESARGQLGDFFNNVAVRIRPDSAKASGIVVVAVDNETLAQAEAKWPWKRSRFAALLAAIESGKPKVVGFDFIFAGTSDTPAEDAAFAQELAKYENVFLAEERKDRSRSLVPTEQLAAAAAGVGYVNKPSLADGVVRMARGMVDSDGRHYPLEAYLLAKHERVAAPPRTEGRRLFVGGHSFLLDSHNAWPIEYRYAPAQIVTVSARSLFDGTADLSVFRDAAVFVGATAAVIHDDIRTPLGLIPGVYVLANNYAMMRDGGFRKDLPAAVDWALVLAGAALLFFVSRAANIAVSALVYATFIVAAFFGAIFLRAQGIAFDYFLLLFGLTAAAVIANVYKYSYLVYVSAKLKKAAITDPVTGFHTGRYFSLVLNQRINARERHLYLVALGIREYDALSRRHTFEEMKNFLRSFARFLEVHTHKKMPTVLFARGVGGKFYMLFSGVKKERVRSIVDDLVHQVWASGFSFGEKTEMLHVSAVLSFADQFEGLNGRRMLYRTDEALKGALERKEDYVVESNVFEKIWDFNKAEEADDELDFLSVDIDERNAELERAMKKIDDAKKDVDKAYFEVMLTLVKALEKKDPNTQGHSERVAKYARSIAKEVGLSDPECETIYQGALVHDIGKIGVPESVLHKKEKLSDAEFVMIKGHVLNGAEILKPIGAFEHLIPMVKYHHEKYDGTGYPEGIHGERIHLGAQIIAVADCFDAITCGRGYKSGLETKDGISELRRCKGTQFNPTYVEAFARVMGFGD
jgi:putative nucleotidyltransferase with HDIG domain